VDSTIVVRDGDTLVVGGIFKTTQSEAVTGVPGLSKIPLLGWLFKYKTYTQEKRELLIFITPRIIQES
jgi:type IV pilus assembly protein PilQ